MLIALGVLHCALHRTHCAAYRIGRIAERISSGAPWSRHAGRGAASSARASARRGWPPGGRGKASPSPPHRSSSPHIPPRCGCWAGSLAPAHRLGRAWRANDLRTRAYVCGMCGRRGRGPGGRGPEDPEGAEEADDLAGDGQRAQREQRHAHCTPHPPTPRPAARSTSGGGGRPVSVGGNHAASREPCGRGGRPQVPRHDRLERKRTRTEENAGLFGSLLEGLQRQGPGRESPSPDGQEESRGRDSED